MSLSSAHAERVKKAAQGLLDLAKFEEKLFKALSNPAELGVGPSCRGYFDYLTDTQNGTNTVKYSIAEDVTRWSISESDLDSRRRRRIGVADALRCLRTLAKNPTNLGTNRGPCPFTLKFMSDEEFVCDLEKLHAFEKGRLEGLTGLVQRTLTKICGVADCDRGVLIRESMALLLGTVPAWLRELPRERATVCHEPLLAKLRELRVNAELLRDLGVDLSASATASAQ